MHLVPNILYLKIPISLPILLRYTYCKVHDFIILFACFGDRVSLVAQTGLEHKISQPQLITGVCYHA
jgi:hypothetical protein